MFNSQQKRQALMTGFSLVLTPAPLPSHSKENGTGAPQDPGPESVTCDRQRLISGKLTPCNRERMQNSLRQNMLLCVALCLL